MVGILFVLACRNKSSTTPTPTPTPPGGLTGVTLTGHVTAAVTNPLPGAPGVLPLQGATIKILDGPSAGITGISDNDGLYRLTDLTVGNATVSANATIYDELKAAVAINGTNTLDFAFPAPSCLGQNTGRIAFRNASPRVIEDFRWDGILLITLAPGQTSEPFVTTAGTHTLQVLVTGTNTTACDTSTPNIAQCSKNNLFTCVGP
jgi:hypothetical protein